MSHTIEKLTTARNVLDDVDLAAEHIAEAAKLLADGRGVHASDMLEHIGKIATRLAYAKLWVPPCNS